MGANLNCQLRYIAELVNANVILPAQLIGLFDVLLTVLDEPGLRIERSDAFVYLVLATIPWVRRKNDV